MRRANVSPPLTALLALTLFALGCPSARPVLDASPPRDSGGRDALVSDDAAPDAAPGEDAGMDAVTADDVPAAPDGEAPVDAAPDAPRGDVGVDAGRACLCPAVPTSCTPPALEAPTFTPVDDSMIRQLFSVIACANTTLRAAIYEADMNCVVDAFVARLDAAPGLTLEVVTDDSACPRVGGTLMCALSRLESHPRARVVSDARSGLMHHKFVIADGARVWVASANMTRRSLCQDANNAIVVGEPAVVAAYESEFRRMFADGNFGPIAPEAAPAAGGSYTAYFSPRSPVGSPAPWFDAIIAAVGAATTTVEFEISAFTRTEFSDALIAAHRRGVRVRGAVDRTYAGEAPAVALIAAGVPVRIGGVHSKLMVIDGNTVITGSPNWSANAWGNNENSLWIRDGRVAAAYQTDFERVYAASTMP